MGAFPVLSLALAVQAAPLQVRQWCDARDGDVAIQHSFDGLRVCASASGLRSGSDTLPSNWPARASRVVLETRLDNSVRRMRLGNGAATYTIDESNRPIDAAATEWRSAVFAVLDVSAKLSTLRGSESALRGEIAALRRLRIALRS
jgi:hypothetical protein